MQSREKKSTEKHRFLLKPILERFGIFLLIIMTAAVIMACGDTVNVTTPTATPTTVPAPVTPTEALTSAISNSVPFNMEDKKEIFYYTVNPDTLETEAVSSMVEAGFMPEPKELLQLVKDSMEDNGYEIGIDEVSVEGNKVIVSFLADTAPAVGLSKAEEKAILDAIAQSLLDNSGDYNKVVFRIMGAEYQSDNYSFQTDDVYMKD